VNINFFDAVFLGLLLIFFLLSYLRGMVKELFTLLGLVVGFMAGTWYAGALAVHLRPMLPDQEIADLLSFLLIMLGCYFMGIFLGGMSDFFRQEPMGPFSRMMGGIIGLAKGLVMSLTVYWVIVNYIPSFQNAMAESWMGARLGNLLLYLKQINLI